MCWGVPGKIESIDGNKAVVEISGIKKDIALDLVEGVALGDYVVVHAGYAIQIVDEEKAKFTTEFFKKKGKIDNE